MAPGTQRTPMTGTREHNKKKRTKEAGTQKKKKNERWAKGKRSGYV